MVGLSCFCTAINSNSLRLAPSTPMAIAISRPWRWQDTCKRSCQQQRACLCSDLGLGSIVHVMRARGHDPRFTLVEKDKTVLGWALEILGEGNSSRIEPVCDDAESFMAQNGRKYDLVFVDVFNGRAVPDFVTTPLFLRQCRDSLEFGGVLAFNYIEGDKHKWEDVRALFAGVLPGCQVVSRGDSRILISPPFASRRA